MSSKIFNQSIWTKYPIYLISFLLILSLNNVSGQTPDTIYSSNYDKYIRFHWKGALTSHSITFKIFPYLNALTNDNYNAFLILYTKTDNNDVPVNNIKIFPLTFDASDNPVGTIIAEALNFATEYSYTFLLSNEAEILSEGFTAMYSKGGLKEFEFKTLGIALTAYNFTFGASCCSQTSSPSSVFLNMDSEDLDFFVHTGNLYSEEIQDNDPKKFYEAYYSVFSSSTEKTFFQNNPIFYVWNDNDFGTTDSNGSSLSKPAVTLVYNQFVPAGPLKANLPTDDTIAFPNGGAPSAEIAQDGYIDYAPSEDTYGIFQSFIVGRCLFVIMDLRSYKSQNDILGQQQLNWLQNQLKFASVNSNIKQVFLVSSMPWIHKTNSSAWQPYTSTQDSIKGWIQQYLPSSSGKKVMMVAGGAHMVAFDNGVNNDFGGFPVVQAGALDDNPNCQGGAYSHGLYQGREQYAVFNVVDNGDVVCVKLSLNKHGSPLIVYDTCHPEKYIGTQATCPSLVTYQEEATTGGSSWVMFLVAFALIGIVGYLLWTCYKNYYQGGSAEGPEQKEGPYMELSETKKKKNENQLV